MDGVKANGAAAFMGLLTYVGYFNRGEHHKQPALYILALVSFISVAIATHIVAFEESFTCAAVSSFKMVASYLAGLYISLTVYRLALSPLNQIPGPLGARLSAFWLSMHLTKADAFRQIRQLHGQYGHFVRVGPTDVSITHPKAVKKVYGLGSPCIKAVWYDLTLPMVSLQTLRDKELHDKRRRAWSTAFSDKALRGYEQRIRVHRQRFIEQVAAQNGQPINISQWFNFYSFDVMGDLAFGEDFGMIENGADHWAITLLNDGINPLAYMFPTWFFRLLTSIPGLAKDWWRFIDFCGKRLEKRMMSNVGVPDVSAALIAHLGDRKPSVDDMNLLRGDAQLIVVAGSDTTATTLSNIIHQLLLHPSHISVLRDELQPYMTGDSKEVLHEKISQLDHLNGVIFEALRLHPPVPTALQRKTPPSGIEIDGTFIPGNTTVYCPQYSIGRDEEIYTQADEFVPERWYKFPDMVKEKDAFAPFSSGSAGCIGKPLALLNIRTTLARLLFEFDFYHAPGETGKDFTTNAVEHFTIKMGDLQVCFVPRDVK